MSRVFARDAAQKVACDGLRWVIGAGARATPPRTATAPRLRASLQLSAVYAAQAGLVADMDRVADALYGRVSAAPTEERAS